MKRIILPSILISLLGISVLSFNSYKKEGVKIDDPEIAKPGMVAYAASYSSDPSNEPKYTTQNNKTFQYLNLGSTLDYYRGDSVKVGIIDSGINYDHEDFMVNSATKVKGDSKYYEYQTSSWVYYKASQHGYSYIDDTLGHGTNVAATVAAAINSVGGTGLAPNVELYVYKVTNSSNGYEFGAIQNALMDAQALGIDVINMSFQSYEHAVSYGTSSMSASSGCSTILSSYLNQAYNAGITLVGAAGNYNTDEPSYPGSNNHVINVGSLNQTGTDKAGFSNYGSTIDLVAPGYVHVADKGTNSSYKDTSGTSFSAPLVTAAIALYIQQNPSATPAEIETALYASCDPIDDSGSIYTNWAGNGALNVAKFLGVDDTPTPTDGPTDIVVNNPEIVNGEVALEVGDTLDLDWTVNGVGTFDDGVEFSLYEDNGTVSVNSSGTITALAAGEDIVTITSTIDSNVSCDIYVTVTAPVAPVTLDFISISGQTTQFSLGDTFAFGGTVTAHYSDSSTANVTNDANFSGYNMSTAGNYTVTVSYGEKSTTYQITVSASGDSEDISDYTVSETPLTSSDIKNNMKVAWGTSNTNLAYTIENNWVKLTTTSSNWLVFTLTGTSSGFTLSNDGNYVYSSTTKKVEFNSSNSTTLTLNKNNLVYGGGSIGSYQFNSTGLRPYTGSYTNAYLYELIPNKTLESISVSTAPTKTTYEAGEYFNPTGLVITRTYDDSTFDTYTYADHTSEFTFSPSTSTALTTGNTSVTITYGGKSTSQAITVTAAKVLSSISVSGYTSSFVEGDTFSFGGTVTAHYTDSSTTNVTSSSTFSGYSMTTLGNQTVTVSYGGKSTTYNITINQGTLSSIGVSGMTTSYMKNNAFAFDGTCTATFANGYQKSVSPTSVTSPDMSTAGNKTITVSFTYNGNTRTTTYDIIVNSNRVVIEETTTTGYSVIGTITYPSDTQTISVNTLSVSTSGYTTTENNSIRLGSGSNTGTVTVTSTTSNITKIVVNAMRYGSDTPVTFTIAGKTKTATSSYADYEEEFSTAVNSVSIATTTNKKRLYIQSITVYETKTTTVETDISSSEDCQGLETFIDTYMHMNYVENLGYCKDSEHHYYTSAKGAFNALNSHQRELFTTNVAYTSEWNRLSAWASANGESLNGSNQLGVNKINVLSNKITSNVTPIIIVISLIGIAGVTYIVLNHKRKEE